MSATLQWYMGTSSHIYTGLLGGTIPASLLWEHVLPEYDPDSNTLLQFGEGIVAIVGQVMTAALLCVALNPPIDGYTLDAVNLLVGPYFMNNAIQKLLRWVRAIRDTVSPWDKVQ